MSHRLLFIALVLVSACKKNEPTPPPPAPAPAAQPAQVRREGPTLKVTVDGKPAAEWTQERLASVTPLQIKNHGGEDRLVWPLRDVARKLVGEKARVVSLSGDDDKIEILASAWADSSRKLVVRPGHRGSYKALWVGSDGSAGDALIRGVHSVEIVTN
jgi:hypothetical protein